MKEIELGRVLTRRQTLKVIGAAGAASLATFGRSGRALAACTVSPSLTQGPYWIDEQLLRSDIRIDPSDGTTRPGTLLTLNINVLQADSSCAPASGVWVDVWHCDAGGLYSDEAANGTVGKKFLRGYQITDSNGAVQFVTIYPGWYSGRTIHIHFRVRTFSGNTTTSNFTSQLFFSDTTSNAVMALAPYNTRGTRDTTNSNDNIYVASMLMAVASDGSGGYVGTFDVALNGLPATGAATATPTQTPTQTPTRTPTPTRTGTQTTLCSDLASCRSAVAAALPNPDTALDRATRAVSRKLTRLDARVGRLLDRAASLSGDRQANLYARARTTLATMLGAATEADAVGTLDASLATLVEVINALLGFIP